MAAQGLKRWIAATLYACVITWSHPSAAREPPAAGCIDMYDLKGGWRSGARELLIRANDGSGARLELDSACPPFAEGVDLATFAPGAWACPGVEMVVRGGDTICPVVRLDVLPESELAAALRTRAARLQAVTLDRVVARGQHWRDIRGTTDRCVDARFLRGWSPHADGLVVEVSPRRHSGNRFYLVETVEQCAGSHNAHSVRLVARSGGAAVCGRPGDRAVLMGHASAGLVAMGGPPSGAFDRGCEISRVSPLPRD